MMSGWYNTGASYQVLAWVAIGLALLFTVMVGKLVVWPVTRRWLRKDESTAQEAKGVILALCLLLVGPWWIGVLWFWSGIVWLQVQPDGGWNLRNAYGWPIHVVMPSTERRLSLDERVRSYTTYTTEQVRQDSRGIGVDARLEMRTGQKIALDIEEYLDPRLATGSAFFLRLGYTPEHASVSSGTMIFDWHTYTASGPVFP